MFVLMFDDVVIERDFLQNHYPRFLEKVKICQNTNRLHYLLNLATIKQDNLVKVYIFEIAEL